LVLVCIIFNIFIICAKVYLRYTTPIYSSQASVYFNNSTKKYGCNRTQRFTNHGNRWGAKNPISDEIALMKSKPILRKVVKKLNLDVTFVQEAKIKKIELYDLSPFKGRFFPLKTKNSLGVLLTKLKQ
jgi:uncharacterized protein involved in exopolysaccharide biosynthesis